LAVIEIRRGKGHPELDFARYGPRCVAREHIDAARLKCFEPAGGVERGIVNLGGVIKDGRRDRPTQIDAKSAPVAIRVAWGEPVKTFADAEIERPAILDRLENLLIYG